MQQSDAKEKDTTPKELSFDSSMGDMEEYKDEVPDVPPFSSPRSPAKANEGTDFLFPSHHNHFNNILSEGSDEEGVSSEASGDLCQTVESFLSKFNLQKRTMKELFNDIKHDDKKKHEEGSSSDGLSSHAYNSSEDELPETVFKVLGITHQPKTEKKEQGRELEAASAASARKKRLPPLPSVAADKSTPRSPRAEFSFQRAVEQHRYKRKASNASISSPSSRRPALFHNIEADYPASPSGQNIPSTNLHVIVKSSTYRREEGGWAGLQLPQDARSRQTARGDPHGAAGKMPTQSRQSQQRPIELHFRKP